MMGRILQSCCFVMALGCFVAGAQEVSPWQRPENSKALLESLGLKLDEIKDREKKSEEYLELYLRVLTRLRQLPVSIINEWASEQPLFYAIESEPEKYRGQIFKVEGSLITLRRVDLPLDLAERFNLKSLFKLKILLDDAKNQENPPGVIKRGAYSDPAIEVWVTSVPELISDLSYSDDRALGRFNKRVAVDATFLMLINWSPAPDIVRTSPVFVADKLKWFPDVAFNDPPVSTSIASLGNAGFDVGLLDAVRAETAKRLTAEVTEPFLQMLAVQRRVDWPELAARPLQLGKLVSESKGLVGEAIEFDAVARRVVEVAIEDAGDRKRLGIDRYFQIDSVIDKPIRTKVKDKDGTEREVEQNSFPVTVCALEAPQGVAIGEDIRQAIRVKAFFFKLWAYESKFAEAQSDDTMQVSPLFITARVEAAPAAESDSRSLWLVIGGAIGILGLIAVWGYLLLRGDDRSELSKKRTVEVASLPDTIQE